ncbi:MAG: helix-turn-helix domain-containing protein [Clostridia bacterium]|nr:helix-turn-helix domain-containing protein [Clostridia bacterium]
MEFESAKQCAERLNVNIRTVQKWAKENRLKGAKRLGREWLIPTSAVPEKEEVAESPMGHQLMPVLSNTFVPGRCNELIESFEDEDDRQIARAEYSYYKGNSLKAAEIAELYLNHKDFALSLSAGFIYVFANLSLGKLHLIELGLNNIKLRIKEALESESDKRFYAYGVFMDNAVSLLLHLDIEKIQPIENVIKDLPKGLKLFGAYIMAHRAYLHKKYSLAAGIAQGALVTCEDYYPVASLYLKLIRTVCLINLKEPLKAQESFMDINRLAIEEQFYQPFVEHHGLLQGIIETQIKKYSPQAYKDIVSKVNDFSTGWRTLHNKLTSSSITVCLSATEFAVAMLFNRSWSVKEISAYLDTSPRMVKHHLSVIYEKLGVSNREELGQFLLK